MKKLCLIVLVAAMAAASASFAATLAGVTVPDTALVNTTPLVLNGVGLRTKFFFKIYVGGLYLTQKASTTDAVLAQTGPDRLLMHMIYAVDRRQFADAWHDGFKDNNPQMSSAVKADVEQFIAYFGNSKKGDVITLDYVPGQGTRVSWNGTSRGNIPGEDFHKALLNVFLGPEPPTRALKKGLLGQNQ